MRRLGKAYIAPNKVDMVGLAGRHCSSSVKAPGGKIARFADTT